VLLLSCPLLCLLFHRVLPASREGWLRLPTFLTLQRVKKEEDVTFSQAARENQHRKEGSSSRLI